MRRKLLYVENSVSTRSMVTDRSSKPFGILMSIGSCWFLGFIIVIVLAACINPDLSSVTGSKFGQPMAQASGNFPVPSFSVD